MVIVFNTTNKSKQYFHFRNVYLENNITKLYSGPNCFVACGFKKELHKLIETNSEIFGVVIQIGGGDRAAEFLSLQISFYTPVKTGAGDCRVQVTSCFPSKPHKTITYNFYQD